MQNLSSEELYTPKVSFPEISAFMNGKLKDPILVNAKLEKLGQLRSEIQIDLTDYISTSAVTVSEHHSLDRTHLLFK